MKLIERLDLYPSTIGEVGCGAGEVLRQLYCALPDHVVFSGFEISPMAFSMCESRRNTRLEYFLGAIPQEAYFDILLALDVFEHVDDYMGFLMEVRQKGRVKIFHIPLDLSIRSVTKVTPILAARASVGHLHYFNKETALLTLDYCGYEILDWFYTSGPLNGPRRLTERGLKNYFLAPLKRAVFKNFPDYWVRTLGGSMMVAAR